MIFWILIAVRLPLSLCFLQDRRQNYSIGAAFSTWLAAAEPGKHRETQSSSSHQPFRWQSTPSLLDPPPALKQAVCKRHRVIGFEPAHSPPDVTPPPFDLEGNRIDLMSLTVNVEDAIESRPDLSAPLVSNATADHCRHGVERPPGCSGMTWRHLRHRWSASSPDAADRRKDRVRPSHPSKHATWSFRHAGRGQRFDRCR